MSQNRLKILASCISVFTAMVIFAIKLYGYTQTGALAFMAGLFDSAIDALASAMLAFAMIHSVQPPDKNHRFGHGKAEGLASFFQAVFILVSGGVLAYQAVTRFSEPKEVTEAFLGIQLTIVIFIITAALVLFQHHVIKRTGSIGIKADSAHYKGDLIMNAGVMVTLALTEYMDTPMIDIFFAFGVAAYFLYAGLSIAKDGLDMLMDRELSQKKRDIIKSIVNSHPDTYGIHDLRTRQSGQDLFIEFHLEIEGALSLQKAHDITHDVQKMIAEKYPDAIITIHQEPAGIDDVRLDDQIKGHKTF